MPQPSQRTGFRNTLRVLEGSRHQIQGRSLAEGFVVRHDRHAGRDENPLTPLSAARRRSFC